MVFGLVSSAAALTDALTLGPSPTDRDMMDPDASTLNFLKAVCRLSSSPSLASDFIVKVSVRLLMFPPVNTKKEIRKVKISGIKSIFPYTITVKREIMFHF